MSTIREAVLNCLENHSPLTSEQVVKRVPFSPKQVNDALSNLKRVKCVKLNDGQWSFVRRPRKKKGYTFGIQSAVLEVLTRAGHPLTTREVQDRVEFPPKKVYKCLTNCQRSGKVVRVSGDTPSTYRWATGVRDRASDGLYDSLQKVGDMLLEAAVILDRTLKQNEAVLKNGSKLERVREILDNL